jgi:hypothetical protein
MRLKAAVRQLEFDVPAGARVDDLSVARKPFRQNRTRDLDEVSHPHYGQVGRSRRMVLLVANVPLTFVTEANAQQFPN